MSRTRLDKSEYSFLDTLKSLEANMLLEPACCCGRGRTATAHVHLYEKSDLQRSKGQRCCLQRVHPRLASGHPNFRFLSNLQIYIYNFICTWMIISYVYAYVYICIYICIIMCIHIYIYIYTTIYTYMLCSNGLCNRLGVAVAASSGRDKYGKSPRDFSSAKQAPWYLVTQGKMAGTHGKDWKGTEEAWRSTSSLMEALVP